MSETLSVVLPVRNGLRHLDAAVRSILDQSFTDFEFLIEDDGSTDGSTELLREWAASDPRIRLFGARPGRHGPVIEGGAAWGTRTHDPIITNDVLYQLS